MGDIKGDTRSLDSSSYLRSRMWDLQDLKAVLLCANHYAIRDNAARS